MQTRYIAIASTLGTIALVGGLVWFTKTPIPLLPQQIDFSKISTTTQIGGYTITPIPVNEIYRPDYKKLIVYSASVSAEAKFAIEKQFADIRAKLDVDQMDFDSWMRLGTLHKIAGNYKGAEEIWVYAGAQWESYVPHANLGDLYLNFLKDPKKAEAQFKAALAENPPAAAKADLEAGVKAAQEAQ